MIAAAIAALLAAAPAPPPPDRPPRPRVTTGAALTASVGITQPDLDEVAEAFDAGGLPRPPRRFATLGAGFLARTDRWLVGAEGHFVLPRTVESGDVALRTSGGFALGELGFIVVDAGALTIYVLVGAGGGGMSLRLAPREAPSFPELVRDLPEGGTLEASGFLLQPALGIDFLQGGDERAPAGLLVGLRAGWLVRTAGGLSLAGQDLARSVDAGLTGPFVRLQVGFGGVLR